MQVQPMLSCSVDVGILSEIINIRLWKKQINIYTYNYDSYLWDNHMLIYKSIESSDTEVGKGS